MEEKDAEVILGSLRVEVALSAGGSPAVESLNADGKNELDSGFHLASVECSLEQAELDSSSVEHAVEIHCLVSRGAVACGMVVEVAITIAQKRTH